MFDLDTEELLGQTTIPGSEFLNGMASDAAGNRIWVTDFSGGNIYEINVTDDNDLQVNTIVSNTVCTPNGITYDEQNPTGVEVFTNSNGWDSIVNIDLSFLPCIIEQPFPSGMQAFVNGSVINALNPLDTGFVDVCLGDSIMFVATPNFYNSLENTGTGYSQDVNTNIEFTWNIADRLQFGEIPNDPSLSIKPQNEVEWSSPRLSLESYLQEYFGKILKKLRETNYQQSQKSNEISFM